MTPLSTTQQEQDLKFDEMFDIWKATDHGSKLENFPENHLNLALKVKEFMHSRDLAIETVVRAEVVEKVMKLGAYIENQFAGVAHYDDNGYVEVMRKDILNALGQIFTP